MLSCTVNKDEKKSDNTFMVNDFKYSFFVAGHTYGTPGTLISGLYPKFYENILEKSNTINFGFLTGDIVKEASFKSWEIVNHELNNLSFEVYMAPGNHDVGDGENNAKRDIYKIIHGETYYSFYKFNDLFIVLDPNISGWDIEGKQLNFLKKSIKKNYGKKNNIFILMHQVIWGRNKDNKSENIRYNSKSGKRGKSTNYWPTLAPLLEQQENDVYIISGDVGAFDNGGELFCKKVKNIKYIASGMGGGARDNYLKITVVEGIVSIEVILLP